MSIDVNATTIDGQTLAIKHKFPNSRIINPVLGRKFRAASKSVGFIYGTVDADLALGGIGLNDGVRWLRNTINPKQWLDSYAAPQIQKALARFDSMNERPTLTMAEASALAFLRVCSNMYLGIKFG